MQITAPIEVQAYLSTIDRALVVAIDTEEGTGDIRVMVNDGIVFDGDAESITSPRDLLLQIEKARVETHPVSHGESIAAADAAFRTRVENILHNAGVSHWKE